MKYPKVSIITINYNEEESTCKFLDSILGISYPNCEVIVVDNGSPSPISKEVVFRYSEVVFLRSEKNLGFAGGNNLGMQIAKGDFYLLINNDTIVPKDFLQTLVEQLQINVNAGISSPKIKYHSNPELIQYAGYGRLNPLTMRSHADGYRQIDDGRYDIIKKTNYPHGACMLIRRDVVEKIGPMPEDYFLYYEELDWANMAKNAGFQILYNGMSQILHHASLSTGKNSALKTYYLTRNRYIFLKRNYSNKYYIPALLYLFAISFPKNYISHLLKGCFANIKAQLNAYSWILSSIFKNPKNIKI